MKPIERFLLCVAILCAAFGVLRHAPHLPAARAEDQADQHAPNENIAICDVWTLTYDMAMSDRFASDRKAYEKIQEEILPLWESLEEARKKYEESEPDDEDYDEIEREYRSLSQRYSSEYGRLDEARERVFGGIVMRAREVVISSAKAIAEEHGYTYVIASHTADDEDREAVTYRRAWRVHVAGPAAVFPDAADITIDVRDDLNLD